MFVSYALEAMFRSNPTVLPEPFAQFARDAYTYISVTVNTNKGIQFAGGTYRCCDESHHRHRQFFLVGLFRE